MRADWTKAVMLALSLAAPSAPAQWTDTTPVLLAQSAPAIGPDQAAAIVQSSTGGQVLSVGSGARNGQIVYRVKVLMSGGRVRVVRVDGASGRIIH